MSVNTSERPRPKDDFLIMRAVGAYVRDGGKITPSIQNSEVSDIGTTTWVQLRSELGELIVLYKFNEKSGRIRKQ